LAILNLAIQRQIRQIKRFAKVSRYTVSTFSPLSVSAHIFCGPRMEDKAVDVGVDVDVGIEEDSMEYANKENVQGRDG